MKQKFTVVAIDNNYYETKVVAHVEAETLADAEIAFSYERQSATEGRYSGPDYDIIAVFEGWLTAVDFPE